MIDYRAYLLNPVGHIVRGWDFRQPTDEEALTHVRGTLKPGQQAEVWQETRRLGLVNAGGGITDRTSATSTAPQTPQAPSQSSA